METCNESKISISLKERRHNVNSEILNFSHLKWPWNGILLVFVSYDASKARTT